MPRLSVCIVHWNTRDDLAACLDALQAYPHPDGQEVVVVDNASRDGAAQMVRDLYPDVRLIANDANRCYAEGCNQAVDAASGDLLLLLNPDARVTEGALARLVDATDGGTRLSAPRLVWPDGRTQLSVRGFPTPGATLCALCGLDRLAPACDRWKLRRFDYERPGTAPQPMASCWTIPRRAWDAVGPMDPRFPLYFNDVDWARRAADRGWTTAYVPDAVVVHDHGGTTRTVRTAALWESRKAFLRYWDKHHPRDPWRPLARMLVTLEAWARTGRWGRSLRGETTPESLAADFAR